MASDVRGRRKTKIGVVVSSKMEKTVVVRVERVYSHPQYAKVVRDSSKYYAHNELDVKGEILFEFKKRVLCLKQRDGGLSDV